MEYIYNVLSSEEAAKTLERLIGVPFSDIRKYHKTEFKDELITDAIREIAKHYGKIPPHHENWTFVFSHITTSANNCASYKQNGILDLVQSYENTETELRQFLDSHDVYIDISSKTIRYKGKNYNVSYTRPVTEENRNNFMLMLKFEKDFAICGFLVNNTGIAYRGDVHERPEILKNIDDVLGTTLSDEWKNSNHLPYEIIVQTIGANIVYPNCDDDNADQRDLYYLQEAYCIACGESKQLAIKLQDHIHILPNDIIDIHIY